MPQTEKEMLVTIALPYANGDLHLGHLLEAIQADIFVRYHKMRKQTCYFVSGEDAHGTAIMLAAQKLNLPPEKYVEEIKVKHEADFQRFLIDFDRFGSSHSSENQRFSEMIYKKLHSKEYIFEKNIEQYFDTEANLFLSDRFIKGTCPNPKCQSKDQYGDGCEVCGANYSPADLKDPKSAVSGSTPVLKSTQHLFFNLPELAQTLQEWITQTPLQTGVKNKLQEWFDSGLKAWDISRDAPYFGFPIPEHPDKYFYVWMDAPIGYMSIFKQLCDQQHIDFAPYWQKDSASKTELYHFIGKDIMYFHTLFWPAMLIGADFKTPDNVFVHGFLTIDGQKMSKSRGTFILASQYEQHLNPEFLRYYFAAKLNENIEDIDLNLSDFMTRINADLIGKVVNIASRCAMFINKYFNHKLSAECIAPELFQEFVQTGESISSYFASRQYSKAIKEIMQLADMANQYIDEQKPWALIKEADNHTFVQEICSMGLNLFLLLITYLKPILPKTAENTEKFFNISPLTFDERDKPLINHPINLYQPLLQRITQEQIDALKNTIKKSETPAMINTPSTIEPLFAEINYDDFAKVDLRIGKIIHAENVEGAEKLLKLMIDIGTGQRQIFAGIKSAYQPEDLVGKLTVVVANLAPRKMRFGLSEGMVLAAGPGGKDLFILEPHAGAMPGMRVK
jgi:methionyl-tRNA synthetase